MPTDTSTLRPERDDTHAPEPIRGPHPRLVAARVRRLAGDLVVVAVWVLVLWHLAGADGGRTGLAATTGAVVLLALPVAAIESRRLPRWAIGLVATLGVGVLASFGFASVRTHVVAAALPVVTAPVALLATRRLLRRRWGAPLLILLVVAAVGRLWQGAFIVWWGHTLSGEAGEFLMLSWRNPSGILAGALGLFALGLALRTARVLRAVTILLAAALLAATWLSGSRAAPAVTALGLAVTAVAGWRATAGSRPAGSPGRAAAVVGAVTGVTLLLAGGIVTGLLAMVPETGAGAVATPITARAEDPVLAHANLRLYHMEAAAGMWLDRPLTGHGLGSYRVVARDHNRPAANLTSSAHNVYLERFADGGLLLGIPFALGSGAVVLLALARLRRPRWGFEAPDEPAGWLWRDAVATAAVGPVLAVMLHAAMDLDWDYPMLPLTTAILAAALLPGRAGARERGPRWLAWGLAPLGLALLGTTALAVLESAPGPLATDDPDAAAAQMPWRGDVALRRSSQLRAVGDLVGAEETIVRSLAWNPGDRALAIGRELVRYQASEISGDQLVAALAPDRPDTGPRLEVAATLAEHGDLDLAEQQVELLAAFARTHSAWTQGRSDLSIALLRTELAWRRDGCRGAEATAQTLAEEEPAVGSAGAGGLLRAATAGACGA